jgi:hypothetical protein
MTGVSGALQYSIDGLPLMEDFHSKCSFTLSALDSECLLIIYRSVLPLESVSRRDRVLEYCIVARHESCVAWQDAERARLRQRCGKLQYCVGMMDSSVDKGSRTGVTGGSKPTQALELLRRF